MNNQFNSGLVQQALAQAQAQFGNQQAAQFQYGEYQHGCTCHFNSYGAQCPLHFSFARAQAEAQFQYDKGRGLYNQPFARFTPTKENPMERNPTDRATALECLRLANTDPTDTNETVVARAEAFFSFVTGQPEASVADRVVEAVKGALEGK